MLADLNSSASSVGMFTLQDELLRARKELSAKENEWKREKMMLMQKTELVNMEMLELRHREANLKKVNDSLTLALSKVSSDGKELSEFRGLIESLKSHTAMSNNAEAALKEQRKNLTEEKTALESSIRSKLEQEFKQKQAAIRSRVEKELEERYSGKSKEQQASLRRTLALEKDKSQRELKQVHYEECQKLKNELERLYGEVDRLHRELERLRTESDEQSRSGSVQLHKSTLIPGTPHPGNYMPFTNQPQKRTALDEQYFSARNNPNIATDLLCEVCNEVFPVNQFPEHLQNCNGQSSQTQEDDDEQQNKLELLRQKKQIESQLNLLQKLQTGKKSKPVTQQVMYVISSDLPKPSKKNLLEKEIKNIVASICNQPAPERNKSPNVSIIRYTDEDDDFSSRFSIKNSVMRCNGRRH